MFPYPPSAKRNDKNLVYIRPISQKKKTFSLAKIWEKNKKKCSQACSHLEVNGTGSGNLPAMVNSLQPNLLFYMYSFAAKFCSWKKAIWWRALVCWLSFTVVVFLGKLENTLSWKSRVRLPLTFIGLVMTSE
jgi:hypothetical protein